MALTNAEKEQRRRERREELVRHAIIEDDTDRDIVRKIVDAIGIDRFRDLAKAMPGLLAAEEKRWAPKTKVVKAHTLADNERFAPGGKLQWYKPNARWHRLRAQAMVPLSRPPSEDEKTEIANLARALGGDPTDHQADMLGYEIHTKRSDGCFPVRYESLLGYCSDSGLLHSTGRNLTWDDQKPNAATLEEAKARAQLHFERRLAGLERAPDEA